MGLSRKDCHQGDSAQSSKVNNIASSSTSSGHYDNHARLLQSLSSMQVWFRGASQNSCHCQHCVWLKSIFNLWNIHAHPVTQILPPTQGTLQVFSLNPPLPIYVYTWLSVYCRALIILMINDEFHDIKSCAEIPILEYLFNNQELNNFLSGLTSDDFHS